MPKTHRLTGLPSGEVDTQRHEVRFDLAVADGRSLSFVGKYGVLAQVTAGLGRMLMQLHEVLENQKGVETAAAERVSGAHIQKDRWTDTVILQLTTPEGTPYTFAIPCRDASELADRLKNESGKPTEVGLA